MIYYINHRNQQYKVQTFRGEVVNVRESEDYAAYGDNLVDVDGAKDIVEAARRDYRKLLIESDPIL